MKNKRLIIVLLTGLLLSGCGGAPVAELTDEAIATFPVIDESELSSDSGGIVEDISLTERFETAGFMQVAGQYTRNVTEDDITLTEMFVMEKYNFLRIANNDMEQEVFAYNYMTDIFTYLYYFDGELMTKTRLVVDTGEVLEDDAGYAELLASDAEALKQYFNVLLAESDIQISDLTPS